MQKGRLTNPQFSLVIGLVSPGIKVGMLKAVPSVDLLILVLKSGPRLCLHKMCSFWCNNKKCDQQIV